MNGKKKHNKDVELVVNLEGEIWRDVVGYEGMYKVSNKGRVASLRKGDFRLLHPNLTNLGYYRVSLKIRPKQTHIFVHRLVAEAFIPNNNTYGTALQRAHETRVRNGVAHVVIAYDLNGTPLARYESIRRAARAVGCSDGTMEGCVNGRQLTSNGMIYLRETDSIEGRIAEINSHPMALKRIARYRNLT